MANIYLFFLVYCILLVIGGHIILLHVKVLCTSNLHVSSSRTTYTLIILKPEHSHNCEYTFLKLFLSDFILLYTMKNLVKLVSSSLIKRDVYYMKCLAVKCTFLPQSLSSMMISVYVPTRYISARILMSHHRHNTSGNTDQVLISLWYAVT